MCTSRFPSFSVPRQGSSLLPLFLTCVCNSPIKEQEVAPDRVARCAEHVPLPLRVKAGWAAKDIPSNDHEIQRRKVWVSFHRHVRQTFTPSVTLRSDNTLLDCAVSRFAEVGAQSSIETCTANKVHASWAHL